MLVKGIDGKEYNWNYSKYANNQKNDVSAGHEKARELLKEIFPFDKALEEVPLPGTGRQPLYTDFFIPNRMLVIEVHGEQHFKFIPFFHKNRMGFIKSQARDRQKAEWCKINDIKIVILKDSETEDEWRKKIESG